MQLKSGDVCVTEFQGPGCFAAKDTFGWFTLCSKKPLVNNSQLLRYFTNVFLETVVKIAMLGLTWKRKNPKKLALEGQSYP